MNAIPKVRKPRNMLHWALKGRRLKYNESPLPLKVKHGDTAWKSRHLILEPLPLWTHDLEFAFMYKILNFKK